VRVLVVDHQAPNHLRHGDATDLQPAAHQALVQVTAVSNRGDVPDDPKSGPGDRTVPLDAVTIAVLGAWRRQQAHERLAWGEGWTDTGLVFTTEDGRALSPQSVSLRFESLAYRSGLPAIRFHDLRHGAAS
jgi:integrase